MEGWKYHGEFSVFAICSFILFNSPRIEKNIDTRETHIAAMDRIIATSGRMTVPQALTNSMNSGILSSFLNRPGVP